MLTEAVLNLNHTIKTTNALQKQFQTTPARGVGDKQLHSAEQDGLSDNCGGVFAYLEEILTHYVEQSTALKNKVESTSNVVRQLPGTAQLVNLVQVSNILELNNSGKLKELAMKAAEEGMEMQKLTMKATQDAAAVKILTILTLIYLPSTVIMVGDSQRTFRSITDLQQNFFSTSFVNISTNNAGSSNLTVAENWWIVVAVTLPLTLLTLYVWWFYVQKELYGEWPVTWHKCHQAANNFRLSLKRLRNPQRSNFLPYS